MYLTGRRILLAAALLGAAVLAGCSTASISPAPVEDRDTRSVARVDPAEFIAALDRAGGNGVLMPLYRRYAAMQGFPSQQAAYRALGLQAGEADGGALRFSDQAAALRLRRAIMAPRTPGRDR